MMKIRELCEEEIKNCGSDGAKLADLAECIMQLSIDVWEAGKTDLSCTYDLIYHQIGIAAYELGGKEYHRFRETGIF